MTDTTAPTVTAQGGFNTGRLYTSAGQRIYWWQLSDGWLYFKDVDRMVDGYIDRTATPESLRLRDVIPAWLMGKYDRGPERSHPGGFRCEYNPDFVVPDAFDFGPSLRI